MKDTACIAIDLGATSGRVILAKMKHGRLETEILNRFPNVIKEIDGRCYWDIYSLFDSIKEGLNIAASRRIAIDSFGVDTWGVDFVCVRPDGSFVSLPRAYRDPYTEGVPEQYFRHIPREEVYRLTGIQFMNLELDMPHTSNNLGVVSTDEKCVSMVCAPRRAIPPLFFVF